ncbi:ccch finger dna binding protein [Physcia stellaris]|nr:ccch finger dna binding protein [Physcia stellaris]
MPPKNNEKKAKPSSSKIVEDKKKGSQAQKQIQAIKSQAASAKSPEQKRKDAEKAQREKEKAASEQAKRETADLFKPVQVQKVPFGVDPKTVLCQFYKQGNCDKGRKCKFSHDLAIERKGEKRNLYQDTRDAEKEKEEEERKKDDMANWDEEKLRQVVLSKHGNPKTTTDKVCKYFIEAVEMGKYGWFWTCPNGGDKCMYKHSLPPGFILKTREQRLAEKALLDKSPLKTLTLEEFLETERQKLTGTLTPVTPETFAKWKKERLDKKAAEEEAKRAKEATGRAMFESGAWEESSDEEASDDDEDDEDGDGEGEDGEEEEEGDGWDMESMRRETERVREEEERRRIEGVGGQAAITTNGIGGEDSAVGVKEVVMTNGVNGHHHHDWKS